MKWRKWERRLFPVVWLATTWCHVLRAGWQLEHPLYNVLTRHPRSLRLFPNLQYFVGYCDSAWETPVLPDNETVFHGQVQTGQFYLSFTYCLFFFILLQLAQFPLFALRRPAQLLSLRDWSSVAPWPGQPFRSNPVKVSSNGVKAQSSSYLSRNTKEGRPPLMAKTTGPTSCTFWKIKCY